LALVIGNSPGLPCLGAHMTFEHAVSVVVALGPLLAWREAPSRPLLLGVFGAWSALVLFAFDFPLAWLGAVLWLLISGLVALRLLFAVRSLEDFARVIPWGFLVGGAVWLAVYTSGLTLLGFSGLAALLTAAHLHFAGFGGVQLAAKSGEKPVPWILAMALGVALLAAGIAVSPTLEKISAWYLVVVMLALGVRLGLSARRVTGVRRSLLIVSALTPLVSGTLAALFAVRGFAQMGGFSPWVMFAGHGLLNAVLFVGAGLEGLRQPREVAAAHGS